MRQRIMREVNVVTCDLCNKEVTPRELEQCALCGKDLCADSSCLGQWAEDGALCAICRQTHEIQYDDGKKVGLRGIIELATGRTVRGKLL